MSKLEEMDLRRKPVALSGVALAIMSCQTLGIVYSDLGTSPLYTLNGIWPASGPTPSTEDVIGGCSAIFWALTIVPLLKYVCICLRFGTGEGEGGTFALFQGLFPKHEADICDHNGCECSNIRGRTWLDKMKWPLCIWSLFGTALTLSDGIFTPAVSVTSAVGGIAVVKPSVMSDITPISIAFLIALFLVQRFGTARISAAFSPVTFLWLALLAATGIMNISKHPGIFRAVDPSRAVMWFVRTNKYDYLAGVLLALTGSEVMFANLGQFNALSIQISFTLFVYPCLVLAYLGQGARIITDGDAVMSNIFFKTIPGEQGAPFYWIIFVVSILTTIIASQTLITASFSLTQQLMNFKSLPPIKLKYTNDLVQGQVYVPAANYLLGIATIIVVAAFKDLAAMSNAYGFAVATVFIVTSSLISIQIFCVKRKPLVLSIAFFCFFVFFDGLFWGAALTKIPHGAWVPLSIGSALTILMVFWTWARNLEEEFDGTNRRALSDFLIPAPSTSASIGEPRASSDDESDSVSMGIPLRRVSVSHRRPSIKSDADGRKPTGSLTFVDDVTHTELELARTPTCALFHKSSSGNSVPHAFYAFVRQLTALPQLVVFLSVKTVPLAHVDPENRYIITTAPSIQGFYSVTYCLGFRDDFNPCTDDIIKYISELEARANPANAIRAIAETKWIASRTTHIIPHYYFINSPLEGGTISKLLNVVRFVMIEEVYRRLTTMFPETDNWAIDNEDVLRIGVNAAI